MTMQELAKLEEKPKYALHEKLQEIVMSNDTTVQYYTGIPSKSIMTGLCVNIIKNKLVTFNKWLIKFNVHFS